MNREIKFRVWDDINKKYTNSEVLINVHTGIPYIRTTAMFDKNARYITNGKQVLAVASNYIIEQYTNTLDANKKEAYEGDKVRYTDGALDEQGNVIWSEMIINTIFDIYDLQPYHFEVIGNIHEVKE